MSYKYLAFIIFMQCVWGQNLPIVNTTQGLVRGLLADDGDYDMFLGIPYAVVDPANPFGPSSPHPEFDTIFDAVDDTVLCPQEEEFNNTLAGTLDCLHLSVFVPRTASVNNPLPVLFWIYGGRFEFGFYGRYLYGPKFLVRHDIIIVSLNYRVGPYGFMCTNNPRVPGNQGIKDQILALRWVKQNIANFGGDPTKVTISGNSAGSMSVDFLIMRNNNEEILFNQAILQSGTSYSPGFQHPERNAPIILSEHFGFQTNDISEALDFLATVDILEVTNASLALGFSFRPCMEQTFEGVESIINHNWFESDSVPSARDLNIIIGFNDEEGIGGINDRNLTQAVSDSLTVTFDIEDEEFLGISQVGHFFFGDNETTQEPLLSAVYLRSDTSFIYPSIRSVDRFLKSEIQKLYMYMFTYNGGRNFVKGRFNISDGGAAHADEIGYLFDISFMDEPNLDDQLVIDRITTMWANFVKYSDPTPETSNLLPVKWEPVTPFQQHYLNIDLELEAGTRLLHDRMSFWDVFYRANWNLQRFLLDDNNRVDKKILDELIPY